MTEKEIHQICGKLYIRNYTINNGVLDVDGDVYLSPVNDNYTKLPLKFGKVTGEFSCNNNKLTTLEGFPKEVGGDFNCFNNSLTSLEYCPKEVGGHFDCSGNQLTSLEYCPKEVGGHFNCGKNYLTNLIGSPKIIKENFGCSKNKLTDLEGCPERVGGDFMASENEISTLKYCPKFVGNNIYLQINELYDLNDIDLDIKIGGSLFVGDNPLACIMYSFESGIIRLFVKCKIIQNGVVDLKRLKYLNTMFDFIYHPSIIKKYYTIKE